MADVDDIAVLFDVWERALHAYAERPWAGSDAAYDATGYGALFHTYIDRDPLLREIHATFGLLETIAGTEPEGRTVWKQQARRIEAAKGRYSGKSSTGMGEGDGRL